MKITKQSISSAIKQNIGFICFLVLMFASRSSIADWYYVPSASMQPTIEIGDRIFVNKVAYRLEVPFTDIPIVEIDTPKRGDIVVFESKAADNRLIKRLIALPGDKVSMYKNRLTINGESASYDFKDDNSNGLESFYEYSHALKIVGSSRADSFASVIVPEGHYLVLGDNRNNSSDSRYYGFVPAEELQGKAINVIASFDPDNYYKPRMDRFFTPLI